MTSSPWRFHLHLATWLVLGALAVAYALAVARTGGAPGRRTLAALGGLIALLVALTWPLDDLAAHTSLTALVVQRLVLLLVVPPLLLKAMTPPLLSRLTRPAPVDWLLRRAARPSIAVVVVTVIAVATLSTAAVEAQGSSPWARAGLDLALVAAGFVLWIPASAQVPATDRPSALGRAGYLIVQSIVPSFLAIVWIFARHPLYPHFAHAPQIFGISALGDQQLAGFVAKFATIAVLWTVAFVGLSRAQQAVSSGRDPDPLLWSDVERHLERAERRERRRTWLPPTIRDFRGEDVDTDDDEHLWKPEDRA